MSYKVSVIIPTYNRADYLIQTIESVLKQDYSDLEVIISDNASTDHTKQVIEKYLDDSRVSYYLNNQNIGMVNNWNKCVYEYVKGDWFLILSDDDYLIDNSYITEVINIIKKNKNLVLVYAEGFIKNEVTNEMIELSIPFDEINDGKQILFSRGKVKPQDYTLCNIVFNTHLSKKLNSFTNEYNLSCDSELLLKSSLYGRIGIIHKKVSVYRIHGNNLVLRIRNDYNLFINNWLYITNTFMYAQDSELLTKDELKRFEKEFLLPTLRSALIHAKLYFPEHYNDIEDKLKRDTTAYYVFKSKLSFKYILRNILATCFKKFYLLLKNYIGEKEYV